MILASWNVNSINVRLPQVILWLQKHRPDILCMQETKMTDEKFPHDAFAEIGYRVECVGEKSYNGVAIASLAKPERVEKGFAEERDGASKRFIEACFGKLNVLNVYIPNGQYPGAEKYYYKLEWIKMLKRHLENKHKKDGFVLLCGDFNVAPEEIDVHNPKLWEGQILYSEPEREAIHDLKDWGFFDSFRHLNPDEKQYSWWDYRMGSFRRNNGLRIDHIWITGPLIKLCKKAWIDVEPRKWERPSDHAPVLIELDL
jgi:exodeoxyribonuclease-3